MGAGNTEMVEAMTGRMSWGTSESSHTRDVKMQILLRCGEKNRLA